MKANAKMRNKLIPAIAMLAVSAVTLTTASYAWFTMSKEVSVTGIQLQATAPDNVLIAMASTTSSGNTTTNPEIADPVWDTTNYKTHFKPAVELGNPQFMRRGSEKLKPASSLTGKELFYTDGADQAGAAVADQSIFTKVNTTTPNQQSASGGNDGYYVDANLWIMTTGETDVNLALDMTKSNIEIVGTGNLYKAVRVAFLNAAADAPSNGSDALVFEKGADNADGKVVIAEGAYKTAEPDATTDDSVFLTDLGKGASKTICTLAKANMSSDSPYTPTKITIRIWLEGQDAECITDNANQTFKFNLVFVNEAMLPEVP